MPRHGGGSQLPVAYSGARTELYRVIDMIDKGHSLASIKAWCQKEMDRQRRTLETRRYR